MLRPHGFVFSINEVTEDVDMVVYSDGLVMYMAPATVGVQCNGDIEGTYDCSLKLGSWTYNGFQVSLQSYADHGEVDTSSYQPHPRWNLTSISAQRNEMVYECCPEPYHDWKMDITITDLHWPDQIGADLALFPYKNRLAKYRGSHSKDHTIMRLSCLHNGNQWEGVFNWNSPLLLFKWQ